MKTKDVNSSILITGATSALIDGVISRLLEANYKITGISRKLTNNHRTDIKWNELDLSEPGIDFSFLKDYDEILHAAAVSNTMHKDEYLRLNFDSTKILVDSALKYKIKRFIYISSILAGENSGDYGLSKHLSELYILENLKNWLIIRPSQLYGYSSVTPIDKLINHIKSKYWVIYPAGDREGIYPMYYKDATNMIFQIAFKDNISNEIKHVIGPEKYNYVELIKHISNVLKRKPFLLPVPRFVMMAGYYFLRITGIKAGIIPDRIYRLYHGQFNLTHSQKSSTNLENYILGNRKQ